MQSTEETCCIVTVFENIEKQVEVNEVSRHGETRTASKRLSCSGTIVNDRAGIVICSGLMFSNLIIGKSGSLNDQFSLPHCIRNQLDVYVTLQASTQQCLITNQCNGKPGLVKGKSNILSLKAELCMLVNCREFQSAFSNLFKESDNWSFYSGDEDTELNTNIAFLSWFAVLRVPDLAKSECSGALQWVQSSCLEKGSVVFACGSPFGTFCPDLFMSTLSKGIVSNLAGEDNVVILTDARCLPGTEGGGLFVKNGNEAYLVGLIASPLCWKSKEWIGLTLVCSFQLIIRNIIRSVSLQAPLKEMCVQMPVVSNCSVASKHSTMKTFPMVALVDSGQFWGSGILMNCQLVLTCRHVLNGKSRLTVRFKTKERFLTVMGEVLYSTMETSPYDVAVVLLKEQLPNIVVPNLSCSFKPGEDVYVIGYGAFGQTSGPTVTSGILSKVFTCHSQPVMLQTTCAVQAGASGGAVVLAQTGELLGLVASNTLDAVTGVTYPHLNFSVPVSVLDPLLKRFAQSGDPRTFQELDTSDEGVRRAWCLQVQHSKL
ncbi:hypothetical protein AGOR_G00112650 [Albula goreensis]|uniref:Peroxisomal leader peptide-processing protease n=1 Tax=Albula goreensis TaxID=1534307 RepID=A0A8T3DD21_9TELE|nr:hypothetical protein AGOR_G00112650 [Albula goreensis]